MITRRPVGICFGLWILLFYLFLYIPIIVLVLSSFSSSSSGRLGDWSLRWYQELFDSPEIWQALKNSLVVAFSSVMLSLLMGMALVVTSMRTYFDKVAFLFYGGLAVPEIVMAVGLLSSFYFFSVPLGLTTLIAGHTLIGLGYVVPMLHARASELDYRLTEASLDLGATQTQTFFNVTLPLLWPAMVGAALLVFIISFDDFFVAFFCAGATEQTLPLYIFSLIRMGSAPVINALSTLLLLVSSLLVILFSSLRVRKLGVMK